MKKLTLEMLADEIRKHKSLYYQGKPEISDIEFDALEEQLRGLQPEHPLLKLVGSDDQIGAKVTHQKRMLSLEKTYSIEDLKKWISINEVLAVYKIDGVSCSIVYQDHNLTLAKTRGDGVVGENITQKINWIKEIPSAIVDSEAIEIRGELYCHLDQFSLLAEKMKEMGLERPTSPRNIVAGLMGRKDHIELCQYLSFYAFDVIGAQNLTTELQKMEWLEYHGFQLPWYKLIKNISEIEMVLESTKEFISEGDYQIDGVVFTYNDNKIHQQLGETSHHPRYRIAFKYQGQFQNAELKDVEWSISMNGIYTPIALIDPVTISGAKIERVTLHNYGFAKAYDLKIGDILQIVRSGEVIPKVIGVESKGTLKVAPPNNCYFCNNILIIDELRVRCDNEKCPGRLKFEILNYIFKIDIADISEKRLDELIRKKLVNSIPDLYMLRESDFLLLDKTKDKLAQKMYQAIQQSLRPSLDVFISALGITGAAKVKCEKIVNHGFNTLEKIKHITVDDLLKIDGFAEKSALDFVKSLQSKIPIIEKLEKIGLQAVTTVSDVKNDTAISGKKFCITGTLSRPREELVLFLKKQGAMVMTSVSKETDYLLTEDTDSDSKKFVTAKKLGTPILNEDELLALLGMEKSNL
jgi:DNA ligase (NAD+)